MRVAPQTTKHPSPSSNKHYIPLTERLAALVNTLGFLPRALDVSMPSLYEF